MGTVHRIELQIQCSINLYKSIASKKIQSVMNFINTKKAFKKLYMFYFETFRIILNPSSVKKLKQHLAMSAIQNHKAL